MATLKNRFIFPLAAWTGASFAQSRLREGDIQVVFKEMRASGYKFVQKNVVKSYEERSEASANQEIIRNKFSAASQATKAILADPVQRKAAEDEFEEYKERPEHKYTTLHGYVFGREFKKLNE